MFKNQLDIRTAVPKFSGKGVVTFENFKQKFENFAATKTMSTQDACSFLISCLEGEAKALIEVKFSDLSVSNVKQILYSLELAFNNDESKADIYQLIAEKKMREGSYLSTHHQLMLGYFTQISEMTEAMKSNFLVMSYPPILRTKMSDGSITYQKTLQDTLRAARKAYFSVHQNQKFRQGTTTDVNKMLEENIIRKNTCQICKTDQHTTDQCRIVKQTIKRESHPVFKASSNTCL